MNFSCLISVYYKDSPVFLSLALMSIWNNQTLKPTEIVLVKDGSLTIELDAVINEFSLRAPVKLLNIPTNKGLGNALREGLLMCSYDIVARMDSDDISVPDRFEKQVSFIQNHPNVSVLGGQITEFIDDIDHIVGKRIVPTEHNEVVKYAKKRCPFNHMSVILRKSDVLKVGNYQDWYLDEDFFLWSRMAIAKCVLCNLPDSLVNVRVGTEMYGRRGGWKYFISEAKLQKYNYDNHFIGFPLLLYNISVRFCVQVLMTNKLRSFFFQKVFRN